MEYNLGDQITMDGVVYTYNGSSWTYVVRKFPSSVTTTATYAGTPVAPIASEEVSTRIPDLVDTYDWEILSRLAMGAIYANEVQVSY